MTLGEVNRRVEMCTAVFGRGESISRVEIAFISHAFKVSLEFELLGSGPIDAI
jgi:hypothetical protein